MHAKRTFMVVFVALVIPVIAAAVTILVPSEQPTIQQGIDIANPGDTAPDGLKVFLAETVTGAPLDPW